ncbi:protein yippee-like At4g27745 [Andrographis paniculata]|uniref:protein yippee-like At4g27745 n=1 Tax=Andrographis paniculata TaxID=175694 RepID=UPI0021E79036|nr:protein yippee-like At4g27745 [Andrographis paniculata]
MNHRADVAAANMPGIRSYSCYRCRTHVALHDHLISTDFQGPKGCAFLFSSAFNVRLGKREYPQMMTGLFMVADVHCDDCHNVSGWRYLIAVEDSHKYKEGKFVIERLNITEFGDED